MEPFYLEIRTVHIAAVLTSGALLLLRGLLLNLVDARWVLGAPVRYLSWTIDTVLLTAAMMLTTIIHQFPFIHGWVTMKVVLLIPYILLGYFALRARERRTRLFALAGAVTVFGFIYSVARAHNPWGFLA